MIYKGVVTCTYCLHSFPNNLSAASNSLSFITNHNGQQDSNFRVFPRLVLLSLAYSDSLPCTIGAICLPKRVCLSKGGTFTPAQGCGDPQLGCCAGFIKTACGDDANGFGICQVSGLTRGTGSSCLNRGKFLTRKYGCTGPNVGCCVTPCSVDNTSGYCQPNDSCTGRGGVPKFSPTCQSTGLQCCLPKAPFTFDPNVYYKLVSRFREPFNECLEGNRLSPQSTFGGAAFMAPCRMPSTGQLWRFIAEGNGLYRLTTKFLEGQNKCFEANRFAPTSTLRGAAFMKSCRNVSGQLWKIKPSGKYFTLTNLLREPFNECLEGNGVSPRSTLGGAAFMSGCLPFTGQQWKAIPV